MNRASTGALALLLITLIGCGESTQHNAHNQTRTVRTTTSTSPPNDRVLVIGDSNIFESDLEIRTDLQAAGYSPTVEGKPSLGLKDFDTWWRAEVPRLLATDPAVVVVALGTNDALFPADVAAFPARLDTMMSVLGDRAVVWLTHVDDRPFAPPSGGRTINADIRAARARWPKLHVLDFEQDIVADPSILRDDHLHFTDHGRAVYARRIAEAVRRVLPLDAPVTTIYN